MSRRPAGAPIVHHSRLPDGRNLRAEVHEVTLALSPPGIEVEMAGLLPVHS
jgi:hypothetical protein